MKELIKLYHYLYKNCQQWWFEDIFGPKNLDMIEFVGLPPILENHKNGCHGNHAFSHSPYQNVLKRTSFRIQTVPLNNFHEYL